MAMTGPGMSAKLYMELSAKFPPESGYESFLQDFCDAAGKAIVEYIQTAAVVPAGNLEDSLHAPVTGTTVVT